MPLTMIKPKGRPATQCAHCRESRKIKQLHTKCNCAAGQTGKHHSAICPCHIDKDLCTCLKNKQNRRTASNPPPTSRLGLTAAVAAATVANTSPSASVLTSAARSSSSSSLASKNRQRKSTIMNSRGAIIHPSSSASLSTKLSLMSSSSNLSDMVDPEDDNTSSSSLPMLFPFTGAAEDVSKNEDLLNSLDSPSVSSYRSQAFFPSSSASSLSTMMMDQSLNGPESLSSLGNFMTSSSNVDGYSSDAEPPLQLNYPHYQPPSRQPMKVNTDVSMAPSSAPASANNHRGPGEIIINTDDSVLDDFTLLSPDENYEMLANGASTMGLLERVDDKSDYSDDPAASQYYLPRKSSGHLVSPNSNPVTAANISGNGNNDVNLFQTPHEDQQLYLKQQRAATASHQPSGSNYPLYPILASSRPPHKELDYASYLAQSRANNHASNNLSSATTRKASPSSTPSSASPSSLSNHSVVPKQSSSSVASDHSEIGRSPSVFASYNNNSGGLFSNPERPDIFEHMQDQPGLQLKDVYPSPFDEFALDLSRGTTGSFSSNSMKSRDTGATISGQPEYTQANEFSPSMLIQDSYYGRSDSEYSGSTTFANGGVNSDNITQNGYTKQVSSPSDSYLQMDP